jgi:transmembrane sensor
MSSDFSPSHRPRPAGIAEQASLWLARRDRGLTPAEQDDYMQWLAADPRHTEAMMQHAAALERMMHLYEWQPVHTTEANPALFAPPPRRRWWPWAAGGALAAAAAVAVLLGLGRWTREPAAPPAKSYLHVNERLALPDGSRVELKDGSKVVVQYSDRERRVKLAGGEAQFSVWKDATRPFVVEAGGIEVRAVGTVFNVRLEDRAVAVLVTEGRVKVNREPLAVAVAEPAADVLVAAGEQTAVPLAVAAVPSAPVAVVPATPEQISQSLAWQTPRLQFFETPLAAAVAEFNRLNRFQIVLGDAELGSRPIGGTFRPDNVEGFVRLLETTLDVRSERRGENETVLWRRR